MGGVDGRNGRGKERARVCVQGVYIEVREGEGIGLGFRVAESDGREYVEEKA